MKIIEVKNLSKSFNKVPVLSDLSFEVKKGTFTALLGKNGSGKSTILNILMGQLKMDKGECLLFGESIKDDPYHLKNKIGHVSEKIRFDYPESMNEFLKEYGLLYDHFDYSLLQKMAKEAGISLNKQFGAYSRGQKMQIVLMSALAHKPELLLIDEITSVLDAHARNYFITILNDFVKNGGTVVITTNIVNEVQHFCTDVIFLAYNKIKFQTPLNEIPANFKKIRAMSKDHPMLSHPDCVESGLNSDGSHSYIVPLKVYESMNRDGLLEDRRNVTLEDLYIYHSQKDIDEKVA